MKIKTDFIPENNFEELLIKTAIEPAFRSQFFKEILGAELYVLTEEMPQNEITRITDKPESVSIRSFSNGSIPVFTSTKRIFDNGVIKGQAGYMAMKGAVLFEILKDSKNVIMNPYSLFGNEFLPNEIKQLLNGEL